MAESSEQVALVHSLVTLSVSDQWTRARVQNDAPTQVVGALLGKQSGRNIEILNTFEVKSDILENGCIIIDEEYYAGRESLFKETFPDLEFLGFYITGEHTETNERDVAICKQAMKFSECPYLMKFDSSSPVVYDKLSIGVFESVADPSNESAVIFHTIPVKIVSELSEQIGLDHVTRFSTVGNKTESTVSKYLSGQFGAMNNLIQGIVSAQSYVKAVREGKVERDDALLRNINKLCQKLREVKPNDLAEKETKQASDNKLIVLLTAITSVEGSLFDGLFGNPLLSSPRGFDQLASQVEQKSMALVQQIIEKDMRPSRTENLASPSTKTTVAMVDDLSNEICCGADLTECTRSMHCDPAFGEAAERSMRKYTGLVETLNTTPELYHALKNSLTKEKSSLDEISIRTANLLLEDFENSGVHLEEDKRREFVQLSDQIFDAGVNFSNGVDAQVPISDEEATRYGVDISELSNPWRTSKDYRIRKFTHGKFFMHDPVREAHLCRLVSSRHQMAKLTGFESYAHRAQGHSILQTYQNVQKFLNGLIDSMTPRIGEEMETIRTFVSENSINFNAASDAVGEWDLDFAKHIYRQRILEQVGDLSDYFSFETVFSGFETIVNKLYGLTLDVRSPEAGEVWPGNVLKLDVYQEDQHQFLGTIYVDLDYRASKMQGDCHFTVRCSKQLNNGEYQTPIVVLSLSVIPPANYFTRSSATLTLEDVSMDFQQAENFFHEMGHAIHSMLGRTRFQHVAGTRCPADFAEIPSHLMECFFNDPAVLTKICRDKSGRPMSMDQAEALISSRNIFGITRTLQQVLYALFDLELHGPYAQAISDGKLTTTELFKQLSDIALPGLERTPNYAYHHRITHLVTYGAKYYSYLVARSSSSLIYDTLFAGNPFSRENGLKWAKVQSHGGEYPSLELLSRVLSKQPDAQQLTGVLQNAVMSDVTKTVPK